MKCTRPSNKHFKLQLLIMKKVVEVIKWLQDIFLKSSHFDAFSSIVLAGFGTLVFPDSVKYRGQFEKGVKHGYGIQLWKTRTYDGEW